MVHQTDTQAARLGRLIDDMMDVSRITSGRLKIEREEFDLKEMIPDVLERMRNTFLNANLPLPTLESFSSVSGFWDRTRIEQVLMNLLTNAMRYGNGLPIVISVKKTADDVRVEVKDEGIGIPSEFHAKIFDRFERAVDASDVSGLGLGLYISSEIVKAHHGKIGVESKPGAGSVFFFELPVLPEMHQPAAVSRG